MTDVYQACPGCCGHGRVRPDWSLCPGCDGIGRAWVDGAPSFDCKVTLGDRNPGEVVTLGNGDRGRIIQHVRRGTPTTLVALIDEFTETEDRTFTEYPSVVGVRSVSHASWFHAENGKTGDELDPLQRNRRTP